MGLLGVIRSGGGLINVLACVISAAVVVFLVMPIHEYAHGFVAEKLGDPTPRWQGRMSLNPLKHIDYMGALMIFLIGFGWSKPVQVDSRYFKNEKRGMALTALAGPLSNIICAILFSFIRFTLLTVLVKTDVMSYSYEVFRYDSQSYLATFMVLLNYILELIVVINLSLAVFNLIPIPPLDGSKILYAVLPDRIYWNIMRYERYLYFALIILLFVGSGLSGFLSRIVYLLYDLIKLITFLPFKLLL